ncbi:hypothetical protein GZ77_01010 [Endozoicomonas montiporae]|uniref:DUF58 domain-containing protein n=2 Tax=Endozoicomonas montiporae TaxID=1027273 RepID=A0A081NA05_9GAMM|nr:DUF58 domain-containing protein [Endozoicomonas montiporae]AMO57049.1 hypothetical protein EZMO1_3014 [Endozoicomonas montiporae CL-33]KEQ15278.1 hypothetical protein GZ77_01010 [Endozoicomonas montiporae]
MSGAYSDLKELVELRLKARDLALFKHNRSRSLLAGAGASPFKGRGVDFEEVRAYQHGDDIRSIDWRVTARRSKPHTKVFREERERPVLILLDQSHSLFFGSRLNFKSVTAAEACSLLAWATLNHGDRVGGVIFNEEQLSEIRPKRSKQTLMHLLKQASELNQSLTARSIPASITAADGGYLAKALRHARRVSHPGTHIFVISDFASHNEETLRHFFRLSRHCEMMAVHISDPMEAELPRPGRYDITNGVHRQTIETQAGKVRQKYRQQYEQQNSLLKEQFSSLKIPFIGLRTDVDTSQQLAEHFGSVRSRKSTRG